MVRWVVLGGLAALLTGAPVRTQAPAPSTVRIGLDHIPVAVRDLDAAVATYRALGFSIKPGRPHANGIRNAHVKFPDGAGIELLTVPAAVDPLSTKYMDMIRAGDGPGFLSFHARDPDALHAALRAGGYAFDVANGLTDLRTQALEYLFWIQDNRSPTDRPEHFAHPNGATALGAVWIATDARDALVRLLTRLGGREQRRRVLAPEAVEATVVTLDEGEVIVLPARHQLMPGRPIVGASFRVPDLATVRQALERGGVPAWTGAGSDTRVVVEPRRAHGLWLEFRPDAQAPRAKAPAAPGAFAVAVTEGDTLLPLARYDGRRWLNTWPEPEEDSKPVPALAEVPAAWLGRPVPDAWTLWFAIGGSTRVEIAGTERTGGCVVSPKLKIRNPPEPPEGSFDFIHAGLATTDGAPVAAIEQIASRAANGTKPPDDGVVRRLEPIVRSLFEAQQQKALDAARNSDGTSATTLTPGQLTVVTPTIDWAYRSAGADPSVVYVEASKRPSPAPGDRLTLHAWLRLTPDGVVTLDSNVGVRWEEDAPGDNPVTSVPDQIPLGVVTVDGRDVWFMEFHYVESATFNLYEIGASAVRPVLQVDGGGC